MWVLEIRCLLCQYWRSAACYVSTGDPLLVMSVLEIRCLLCQYWRSAACYVSTGDPLLVMSVLEIRCLLWQFHIQLVDKSIDDLNEKHFVYFTSFMFKPRSHASKTFCIEAMKRIKIITFKLYLREGNINKSSQLLSLPFYESATYLFV
jgi:hypothetical protein